MWVGIFTLHKPCTAHIGGSRTHRCAYRMFLTIHLSPDRLRVYIFHHHIFTYTYIFLISSSNALYLSFTIAVIAARISLLDTASKSSKSTYSPPYQKPVCSSRLNFENMRGCIKHHVSLFRIHIFQLPLLSAHP